MSTQKLIDMYDLVYIVDGKVREVIIQNRPIEVCQWRKNQLKNSTHRLGLLQPRKTKNRPKEGWLN